MPLPIAAGLVAKFAAPLVMKGIGKLFGNRAKKKQLQEQQRAQQQQSDSKYQSDFDTFENREDDRGARTGFIGQQLKGARSLSPEILAAALKRRKNTAYKGAVVDQTKGMGSAMVGDAFGGLGDLAANMNREGAIANAEGGGSTGGILSQASQQMAPVSMGGQTFDFRKKEDEDF